jgi:2-desacetyl-2-hydroxyethyl bacteriochlorophyllide A dehydrogenase
MPKTSIIIRTFNEEKHLGDLLRSIRKQDYKDWEIVIVDSGSTDNTLNIAQDFGCDTILQIKSRDFTFGYSLNTGCRQSRGEYLVFVSAHVLPRGEQWLANLLAPFSDEKVAMVYGRQAGASDSKFSEGRDFQRIFTDSSGYANNANAAVRRNFWREHPFDEYLFGLEDVDWAKRAQERGLRIIYQPKAVIYHIHNEKWPQIFNRYRREAIAAARLGLPYPPQARPDFFWLVMNLAGDFLASLSKISLKRCKEIVYFRYLQWKGTRQGWYRDKNLDFNRDKYALFYPSQNRAVVIRGKHQARIEETSLPAIKPGDILVQVDYVGVCRTDLEIFEGTLGYYRDGVAQYPIVPGHEFSGTIIQIGASSRHREIFQVGQKVIGECILSRGDGSLRQEVGVINYNGAYSDFLVMPGQSLHIIPEGLDLKTACLAEPLAVVLRALRRANFRLTPQTKVAIIGAGAIGNLCAQVLVRRGFAVTVFDKSQARLDYLNGIVEATSVSIDGLSQCGFIVEATGVADVLRRVLKESRLDATILLLGFPYGNIDYNFEDIVGKEKTVMGSVGGDGEDFMEALRILPGLKTAPFTQNVLALEDFKQAWDSQRDSKQLKTILKIQKDAKPE